ncbi:MAG: LptE family protein [Bacteroidales bacterium]|nr:LptE family protein [Bacteroidales bacterium]
MRRKLLILSVLLLALAGCGIVKYSFTGTSIDPDVHTICIPTFEYKAMRVNPSLANELSEELRTRFRRMTSLEQVEMDGDLEITGEISGYDVQASAVTGDEVAAQNRLTVSVRVEFNNVKHPEESFTGKSFSAYADYDSSNSLDAVESTLCAEIIDKIVEDIFNATVAQW